MGKFKRIFHHITVEDVKNKWSDSLEESIAKQFKEDDEKRIVNGLVDEIKSDWKSELSDLWKQDWRDKLNEGMTTSDTFSYSKPGRGDTDLATTGLGYTEDGIHQLQNIPPMTDVDDPTNVGKKLGGGPIGLGYHNAYGGIDQYTSSSNEASGIENTYWKGAVSGTTLDDNDNPRYSDYIYPFDRRATGAEIQTAKDATLVRGENDVFRATYPTNVFVDRHKATPVTTNPTVGVDDAYETVGLGVRFGGAYDTRTPRFFVPAGTNTSEIDTVKILASVGGNSNTMTQAGSQLQLYYWAGDKPGFQSLQNELSHNISHYPQSKRQFDGWRPIAQKPNGEIDGSIISNIIDLTGDLPLGFVRGQVSEFTIQIPEWCRSTSTRFMFLQMSSSNGGPTIYSIRYQRRNALTINTTLADEKASAFVRVGNNSQMSPEERKKKLNDMLKASRAYMLKSLGFASLFNDEVKISDVVSSNFDFQSVMQGSGAFGNTRFNDLVSSEKRQAQAKKYRSRQTKSRSRKRGYKITGKDSKGMTTSATMFNEYDMKGKKLFEKFRSNLRKKLQEQPAFKAVPLPSTGMNTSQDFAMFTNIGGMHNDTGVRFTLSGLGGTESLPIFNYPLEAGGSVKAIDVFAMGQNNSVQIDLSNFGLQGRTIPLGSKLSRRLNKKKEEDMNKQLNSSENFTKKINADEYMKARVTNVRIDKAALEKQKADEKFLNKQQTIVNLTRGFGMIGLPNDFAQWTLNYARGNLTPITKFSRSMTNQVRDLVLDKFAASPSGTKTVSIQYGDYGGNPFSKISTKLGLGRFTATKLPNGDIKITDTFNVDKTATHIGSARMIPGLQDTANRLVNIAHERRGITGNYDEGGIPINVVIKNSGRFAADAEHNKNRRSMQRGKYYSGLK